MKTEIERFFEKTNQDGNVPAHAPELGKCWEWLGAKRPKGYGTFMWSKKVGSTHRFSYLHFNGAIPAGHDVMHKCDNPRCVNPKHLETGTRTQNMQDCKRKGRDAKGEKVSNFTNEIVLEIRRLYDSGEMRIIDLKNRFQVSRGRIGHIVYRTRWTHI